MAALLLAPMLVGGQVQYGPATRYEGTGAEVKFSVPASAGGVGTYCFQVRAIGNADGTESASEWSDAHCARLSPPVTVTLAWDPANSSRSPRKADWVHVAYEVRVGLVSASTKDEAPAAKPTAGSGIETAGGESRFADRRPEPPAKPTAGSGIDTAGGESMFADRRPEVDYQEAKAYELGARFVATRGGRVVALRFFKGSNEGGAHTGRVWSASGQLFAEVTFENETASGWQEQHLLKPVIVKAGTPFLISVTTDPSGRFVVTPDDLRQPLTRGSLRAETAVFGSLGQFPRTRRRDNYLRDVVFVPDP